ncbi:hypothetical protein HanRHA438_Chr07g0312411 [Helianthus annuus]|nr:hypothetical protein HanIR_Chr07g0326331 [Helianthus annuus]KAJ0908617.1 hypothetical protein HanRHA438_Chr07g0312411 [Helianthus annuus]
MLHPTKRTKRVTIHQAPCRPVTNQGADRHQRYDVSSMSKYRHATCTTTLTTAEETKRIFPLVRQLAPNNSWQCCSSLFHHPAINRTLHHSGERILLSILSHYTHIVYPPQNSTYSHAGAWLRGKPPHTPLLTRLTVLLFCRILVI